MKRNMVVIAVLFVLSALLAGASEARIAGKAAVYRAGGVSMNGFLAYDADIEGPRPGVLVVHEWWGLNDYARKRARMLAAMGYTALAVDMYGGGRQAAHPDEAGTFSSGLMKNFGTAKARFMAALEFLKKQKTVDPDRIAAIGYCFGGGIVLNMARQGVDLKGVASFHGSLTAVGPAQPGEIKARILVLHGADDAFVTPEQIDAFNREMKAAGADYQLVVYTGAMHSFTNPDADRYARKYKIPVGYNARADRESWAELAEFLAEMFKQ